MQIASPKNLDSLLSLHVIFDMQLTRGLPFLVLVLPWQPHSVFNQARQLDLTQIALVCICQPEGSMVVYIKRSKSTPQSNINRLESHGQLVGLVTFWQKPNLESSPAKPRHGRTPVACAESPDPPAQRNGATLLVPSMGPSVGRCTWIRSPSGTCTERVLGTGP